MRSFPLLFVLGTLSAAMFTASCSDSSPRRSARGGRGGPTTPTGGSDATVSSSLADAQVTTADASGDCVCDLTGACDPGCACDPDCPSGEADASAGQDAEGPMCACDVTPGMCDNGCACDPDCGPPDCSQNPQMCVPFELKNPADCSCLGVCEAGYRWDSATETCVMIGSNPDASTPGPTDAGTQAPDASTPTGDPFNPGPLASQLASAVCNFQQRCEPASLSFTGQTLAQCQAAQGDRWNNLYQALSGGVTLGRIAFSQANFTACVNALGSADCDLGFPQQCEQVFAGQQRANQPCFLVDECATGLWCRDNGTNGCGTCVARTANGGDCSASFCIEGSICADTGMSQVCVAQNTVNAACGTLSTGLCQGHLICVGQPTGTCRRPARAGATCDETLTSGPDCDIFRNATCENGRCIQVNWRGPNESCGSGGNLCDNRGDCDPSTLRCVALPSAGQACNMGACTRNTACVGTTCQSIAGIGDACQPGQCENERGIFCQGGTCSPLVFQNCP